MLPCVGGPLDHLVAPKDLLCFPWPEGWYYNYGTHYHWRSDPFIDQDAAWWIAEILPLVELANPKMAGRVPREAQP